MTNCHFLARGAGLGERRENEANGAYNLGRKVCIFERKAVRLAGMAQYLQEERC